MADPNCFWTGSLVEDAMARCLTRAARLLGFMGTVCAHGSATAAVQLPLEVIGPSGTTVSCQFDLPEGTAPGAINRLWMQIHGLSYANKASIQINNSSWIALNNSSVTVLGPGKNYGGIGGAFTTLKMTLPIPAGSLVAGANTLRFKMNPSDGVSIGYRVLLFNLLTTEGESVLPGEAFGAEDFSQWAPPMSDAASIAAGEALWRTKTLRATWFSGAGALQAKCADCHAQDGRDLKYFNYSNHAIVQRSKFHGLTEVEGRKVASYIRTRPTPSPGRPWNPPYQPGPGLDSRPLSEWSAGAGIQAVLEDDLDALPLLFPNGISKEQVATTGTLNLRELPVVMQLPDWNHWLPTVHPKDAWGAEFILSPYNRIYSGTDPRTSLRLKLSGRGARYLYNGQFSPFRNDLDVWSRTRYDFLLPKIPRTDAVPWSPAYSQKIYATALWQLVKVWELMHEFNGESSGPLVYGSTAEARTWFTGIPFAMAPHKLGIPVDSRGLGGSALKTVYFSSAWYHLQSVLDNGNRRHNNHNPVDWGYVYGHISHLDKLSGVIEPMRLTAALVKAMQNGDNGIGPETWQKGWNPRNAADVGTIVAEPWAALWSRTPVTTRQEIMEALLANWFDKVRAYPAQAYFDGRLADAAEQPTPHFSGPWGGRVLYMIPRFRGAGVDEALLGEISDWATTIWPRADWESVKSSDAVVFSTRSFR